MSDYMFNLESHLNPDQSGVLGLVQAVAGDAGVSLYLTGGALRDMLGGFPIRDLDFTVEGPPSKIAKTIAHKGQAEVIFSDELRKTFELQFPSGVRCEIGMARQEKYGKPGSKPHVTPATIHEDLRGRDFTINALGLSLNRASRGLMIDPTNGAADIQRKELRTISTYGLYDDPARILRLLRFKVRFDFAIHERTQSQYQNVRQEGLEKHIPARTLFRELRAICLEQNPLGVLQELAQEGLLTLFSPGLTAEKFNVTAFQRLQKVQSLIPFGAQFSADYYALSMVLLTQVLSPKERTALIANTKMEKEEMAPWQKLDAKSKKLESVLKSAKLSRASKIYDVLVPAAGEEVLYLYLNSKQRIVHDRIKNHFEKHLPTAVDVSNAEVTEATGIQPDDPKFAKAKADRISARLDGRVKKPVPPEEPAPPPQPPRGTLIRGARFR